MTFFSCSTEREIEENSKGVAELHFCFFFLSLVKKLTLQILSFSKTFARVGRGGERLVRGFLGVEVVSFEVEVEVARERKATRSLPSLEKKQKLVEKSTNSLSLLRFFLPKSTPSINSRCARPLPPVAPRRLRAPAAQPQPRRAQCARAI